MRLAVCLCAVALAVPCASLAADEGVIEATGEATIVGGDQVAAKKAATADALRHAIENVIGFTVQSEFSSDQRELVKGNQSQFDAKVQERLTQRSEGFVQKYEVLDGRAEGSVFKVKLRAHVFADKLKAELRALTDLIAAAGNPTLMLVIQEVTIGPDGKESVAAESVAGALIEKELLARGFALRGRDHTRRTGADWLGAIDPQVARDAGADVLIAGRIEIRDKGVIEDTGGLEALKGQRRVEIATVTRGVLVASGQVVSSKPVTMSSVGINIERAVFRAFQGRGNNMARQMFDDLLSDLTRSFKQQAESGQSYVVQLGGVKSFKEQAMGFLGLLERLSGVSSVRQQSFGAGVLVVDVACKCSSNELQQHIFSAASQVKSLSSIDVENVSGKRLSFKL